MSVSARSFLIPAAALATAGAVALTPAMTSATSTAAVAPALTAAAVPAIHIEEIQLAGIGRDIYDSITNFVQYTVSSAEFWIDLIPLIGPPLADQLNINYFEGIQPLIASTVYFISDVIANPLNVLELAVIYGQNLFYTGYNWVSAQSQFFGLPPLAPIPVPPPLASVSPGGRGAAAAVAAPATEEATDAPAAVATAMESAVESAVTAETPEAVADVTVARPDARGRAARANADAPRPARAVAGSAEATTPEAAGAPETAQVADGPQRGSAKADRGAARAAR